MKRRTSESPEFGSPPERPLPRPVSAYVRACVAKLLDERRIVVWYDGERAFGDLINKLALANCSVVSAADSPLTARRAADKIYRDLDGRSDPVGIRQNLLIYVPRPRATSMEARGDDPFEGFARCGTAFGSVPAEQLESLAQLALPDRADEIVLRGRDGKLTLALLDALPGGASYPRLRAALGTESPIEAIAAALGKEETGSRLSAVDGSFNELTALARTAVGLSSTDGEDWLSYRDRLAAFILLGELANDRSEGLPVGLTGAAHAPNAVRQVAFDVLDRLRETEDGRDAYVRLATAVEADYHVASALGANPPLGSRDTFPCQDSARLRAVVRAASEGDLATTRDLATVAETSTWGRVAERRLLWTTARQCLAFLEIAAQNAGRTLSRKPRDLVAAYVAPDGYWQLDRPQRHFEQANASGYFHEGLSLQECVVPIVVVRPRAPEPAVASPGDQVTVTYRSDRVEIRAIDPRLGVILARLALLNGRMD